MFFSEGCAKGKAHRRSFRSIIEKKKWQPDKYIYTDVCGLMRTRSYGGNRWFVLFKDEATGFRKIYLLRHKNEAFERFKQFENYVEKQWKRSIKIIRSDRGLEYVNHEFEDYLAEKGITAERTASYTPEQNGRSERDNRTIARSMMEASNLEEELWAELCVAATYFEPNANKASTRLNAV